MKIVKKRFRSIKERTEKLLAMLLQASKSKSNQGDVLEMINVLKYIIDVSDLFLNTNHKYRPILADEGAHLDRAITGLDQLLRKLMVEGKFSRVFQGHNLRFLIDQQVARIYESFIGINNDLQLNPKKKEPKKSSKVETKENPSQLINDEAGRKIWANHFGEVKFYLSAIPYSLC